MFSKMIAVATAVAVACSPVAAAAAPANSASSLSVAKSARAATTMRGGQKASGAGMAGVYIVGAALLVGFGWLVVDNADRDDSDSN